jgi:hypothetical protein
VFKGKAFEDLSQINPPQDKNQCVSCLWKQFKFLCLHEGAKPVTCKAIGNFFKTYCGNTAVDLYPLPVSRARLTVVEPALFE